MVPRGWVGPELDKQPELGKPGSFSQILLTESVPSSLGERESPRVRKGQSVSPGSLQTLKPPINRPFKHSCMDAEPSVNSLMFECCFSGKVSVEAGGECPQLDVSAVSFIACCFLQQGRGEQPPSLPVSSL